jgi:TonB family protein
MSAIGELENASLSERLRELRSQRFSGAVRVREAKGSGAVFLVEGRIVHAEYGRLAGESAYWQLFGLPDVQIDVIEGAVPDRYSILRPVPTSVPAHGEFLTMEPPPPPLARSERSPLLACDDPRFAPPPPVEASPARQPSVERIARAETRSEPASGPRPPGPAAEPVVRLEARAQAELRPQPRSGPDALRLVSPRAADSWSEGDDGAEARVSEPRVQIPRSAPEPRPYEVRAARAAFHSGGLPRRAQPSEVEKPPAAPVDDLAVAELTARLAALEDKALRLESLLRDAESRNAAGPVETAPAEPVPREALLRESREILRQSREILPREILAARRPEPRQPESRKRDVRTTEPRELETPQVDLAMQEVGLRDCGSREVGPLDFGSCRIGSAGLRALNLGARDLGPRDLGRDRTRFLRVALIMGMGLLVGGPLGVYWKVSSEGLVQLPQGTTESGPVVRPDRARRALAGPAPVGTRPRAPASSVRPAADARESSRSGPAGPASGPLQALPASAAMQAGTAVQSAAPADVLPIEKRAVEVGDLVAGPGTARPELQEMPVLPSPDPSVALAPEIVIRVLVDERGSVARASIFGSRPGLERFERAALEAGQQLRFKPAEREGKPVPVWIHVPVRFR